MVERSGRAQTSVCFCGRFYWCWNVKFCVGKGFYSFGNTIVIYGGRAVVTVGEPVLLCGGLDVDGTINGGVVVMDGGAAVANGGDWEVGRSDGV